MKLKADNESSAAVGMPANKPSMFVVVVALALAYLSSTSLSVRFEYRRGMIEDIARARARSMDKFPPAQIKACNEILIRDAEHAPAACRQICEIASTLGAARREHVKAMRDKFSHVEWISEAFDSARGVKQADREVLLMETKSCVQLIERVDQSNRLVDNVCAALLLAVYVVVLSALGSEGSVLMLQCVLVLLSIDDEPMWAVASAMVSCMRPDAVLPLYTRYCTARGAIVEVFPPLVQSTLLVACAIMFLTDNEHSSTHYDWSMAGFKWMIRLMCMFDTVGVVLQQQGDLP